MRQEPVLTRKGARQAEVILDAAVRVLGRDGYAAASLGRIAEEAGTHKRLVLYYYGTREGLFERVAERVGQQLLSQVAASVRGLEDPDEIVRTGFSRVWEAVTTDRALVAAYFGLVAESVVNRSVARSTAHITDGFRDLIRRLVADAEGRGRRLDMHLESFVVLVLAGIQGLTLEYLERGDTPALRAAAADYQRWLALVLRQGDSGGPRAARRRR